MPLCPQRCCVPARFRPVLRAAPLGHLAPWLPRVQRLVYLPCSLIYVYREIHTADAKAAFQTPYRPAMLDAIAEANPHLLPIARLFYGDSTFFHLAGTNIPPLSPLHRLAHVRIQCRRAAPGGAASPLYGAGLATGLRTSGLRTGWWSPARAAVPCLPRVCGAPWRRRRRCMHRSPTRRRQRLTPHLRRGSLLRRRLVSTGVRRCPRRGPQRAHQIPSSCLASLVLPADAHRRSGWPASIRLSNRAYRAQEVQRHTGWRHTHC